MALIVITNGTKVARIMPSTDESSYIGKPDVRINPNLPACEQRYMVVEADSIREQTAQEKQADLDDIAAAQAAFDAKVKAYTDALAAKYDALTAGIATMQGKITTWNGTTVTAASQLKQPVIDVATALVGVAQTLNDLRPLLTEFYKDWAGRQP
jgi:uncharacterized protein YhaN